MKLSVIIPVYNVEKYLENCVKSVLNQSYKDIEIILINDGSSDKSGDICNKLANEFNSIKVIHQENMGVSTARNRGLDEAKGDLITFVDSDDTIDSDMYEVLINLLNKHNLDVSHCSYKRIDKTGSKDIGGTGKITIQNKAQAMECLISGRLFNASLCNKVFRKEVIQNLRFDKSLKINEDVLLCVQSFLQAESFGFIDVCKYNYLIHENASATNTTANYIKANDYCIVSKYIFDNVKEHQLVALTTNRYANSLCNLYRVEKDKNKIKSIKEKLKELASHNNLFRNNKTAVILIVYFPWLYKVVYGIYNKIRVPNWDVK